MRLSPLANYLSLKWLSSDCAASTISKSLLKGFSLGWPGNSLESPRGKCCVKEGVEESLENPDAPTT